MKCILHAKGKGFAASNQYQIKSASWNQQTKKDFFRGKDFKKWVQDNGNKEFIRKKCQKLLENPEYNFKGEVPDDDDGINRLGELLLTKGRANGHACFVQKADNTE